MEIKYPILLTGAVCAGVNGVSAKKQPNIVVIVADDLGYALGANYGGGGELVPTPNLDRFGREGIVFSDGYVSASTSGPSRAGILTGCYQQRFGVYANCDTNKGLPAETNNIVMLPTYLKGEKYVSTAIGKWHAGGNENQRPLAKGFDECYCFCSAQTNYFSPKSEEFKALGLKRSPQMWDNNVAVSDHDYTTYEFTDQAIDFIERNKENPFLVYLAYNAVHGPVQVPQSEIDKFNHIANKKDRVRAAFLSTLDSGVGRVLDKLKESGVDDNTLVFFLSDNGGLEQWGNKSNGDLRGYKRERWDGGIRVQFMMRYPNVIDAGQRRSEVVSSLDIVPTILSVAGIEDKKIKLDGEDMSPLFKSTFKSPIHDAIYWGGGNCTKEELSSKKYEASNPPPAIAVRTARWKFLQILPSGKPHLFDMESSCQEEDGMNLAAQYPEVVKQLQDDWRKWFIKCGAKPLAWSDEYYQMIKKY